VPSSDYCWELTGDRSICEHFDYDGGHNDCTLGFYLPKSSKDGCKKPKECGQLKIEKSVYPIRLTPQGILSSMLIKIG